ncbi:hypothetical protein GEMRC1_009278 [Eukaryota sp. GEM-RC1]
MKLVVHTSPFARDVVEVGDGSQTLEWLCFSALTSHDFSSLSDIPLPKTVRDANGTSLPLDGSIKDHLSDGQHVWLNMNADLV